MTLQTTRNHFELLRAPGPAGAVLGIRLVGRARDGGAGLCRLWLRRVERWDRAIDPRQPHSDWDCRTWIRADSAFALQTEWTLKDLDALAEQFEFPQELDSLRSLRPVGDPVFDTVLAWAQRVTNSLPVSTPPAPVLSDAGWDEAESAVVARMSGDFAAVPETPASPTPGVS